MFDVYGIGNALVDTEYEVTDELLIAASLPKGQMTLMNRQEREQLINLLERDHNHEVVKKAGGGSAANTLVAVAQLGGRGFYSCKVAADAIGDFFLEDLTSAGVKTNLDKTERSSDGTSGQCVSMITPDAERTLTTHLGISETLSPSELDRDALTKSTYLYIEGYLVTSPTAMEAVREAQHIVRTAGGKVSITLSDMSMVQGFGDIFTDLVDTGIDLIFCNEEEAMGWTQTSSRSDALNRLRAMCQKIVITCGSDGALVYDGSGEVFVPGVPINAVDTTGAGDIFAGAFLYGITAGLNFEGAATLANRAASRLVSAFGARLEKSQVDTLLS